MPKQTPPGTWSTPLAVETQMQEINNAGDAALTGSSWTTLQSLTSLQRRAGHLLVLSAPLRPPGHTGVIQGGIEAE